MLIRFLDYSGAPTMFMWVAEALYRRGHQVTICTYDTQLNDIELSKGIKWIDLTPEHKGFCGKIKSIRRLVKKGQYDACIAFQLDANVYSILACLGLKTKSVVCERNDPYKPGYYKLKMFYPLFRFADGAVFQLPGARAYYKNIEVPVAIIPNPFVAKTNVRCASYDKREMIIASHGRLNIFQKRQDVLIDAFALLIKDYPDYKLQIFGGQMEGDTDEERLKTQIRRLGLVGKVELMGVSKKPQEDIKDAMVWVSTSDFEGISNALMDAMAIGIPCVATDCSPGGAAFLIKDKVNGLLVEKGNPVAVYKGIKYMIEHPQEADEMGRKALEIEDDLDSDKIAEQWDDYVQLICKA